MSRIIMLIPDSTNVWLTNVSLGVMHAMKRKKVLINVFKPIAQSQFCNDSSNHDAMIIHKNNSIHVNDPIPMEYVELLLSSSQKDVLMEEIIARYYANVHNAEVVLIEGLVPTQKCQFANMLNYEIAKMLNAEIIFLITLGNDSLAHLKYSIKLMQSNFGGIKNKNVIGVIINKLNIPIDKQSYIYPNISEILYDHSANNFINIELNQLINNSPLPILGYIPWNFDLIAIHAIDICHYLDANIINEGDIYTRRVKSIIFCACNLPHMIDHFRSGSLLVTPADRLDVLIAACLAVINGVEIGAILLTGGYKIDDCIYKLCKRALQTGLPVFIVNTNTWQTSLKLQSFNLEVACNGVQSIEKIHKYVADHINIDWLESLTTTSKRNHHLSPLTFRYKLTELARQASKRIVLPEGNEPRTIKAAAICAERGIAKCVLLGNQNEINCIAATQGITLGKGIEIIDPKDARKNYVARLIELRKNKGMTEIIAKDQLKDNVVLGTMMLERDEVDGLVSGAIHTTANTIRPSLQLIKTAHNSSLVSSIFFMLLPEEVLVYGDCAINPDPTAAQLAEIAIQSADSAAIFGIEPRVAMISYSTGNSGEGSDVDKVREATIIAQKKRPDLIIDGPLQYDAAIIEDVAKLKAPNSKVAGHATVLIFPDLNTGNTTYKAVQRSANLISIGPMLQGMRKPVNDLSRGALVDDIIYTIAITAIQASQ